MPEEGSTVPEESVANVFETTVPVLEKSLTVASIWWTEGFAEVPEGRTNTRYSKKVPDSEAGGLVQLTWKSLPVIPARGFPSFAHSVEELPT